jgi:hypothetical protein
LFSVISATTLMPTMVPSDPSVGTSSCAKIGPHWFRPVAARDLDARDRLALLKIGSTIFSTDLTPARSRAPIVRYVHQRKSTDFCQMPIDCRWQQSRLRNASQSGRCRKSCNSGGCSTKRLSGSHVASGPMSSAVDPSAPGLGK